jgi:DNA-directed RNA polymerase sigma subunit (sigma70/sigma32)
MECDEICRQNNQACQNKECRHWLNYEDDLNCTLICANKNGPLTLREVAKRLNISYVRVQQIEENAIKKIKQKRSVLGIT